MTNDDILTWSVFTIALIQVLKFLWTFLRAPRTNAP
jgi:hypothetical protein